MSAGAEDGEKRRELRSYGIGFAAAAVLTAAPFAAVASGRLSAVATYWIVGVCALVQLVVHFRFFLHITLRRSTRDDLQLILFTSLIVLLMAGGTIWILANLHDRMM